MKNKIEHSKRRDKVVKQELETLTRYAHEPENMRICLAGLFTARPEVRLALIRAYERGYQQALEDSY